MELVTSNQDPNKIQIFHLVDMSLGLFWFAFLSSPHCHAILSKTPGYLSHRISHIWLIAFLWYYLAYSFLLHVLYKLEGPRWNLSSHSWAKETLPGLLPVLTVVLRFTCGALISSGGEGPLPLDDDLVISGFFDSFDSYKTTFSNLHFCQNSCGHPAFFFF